MEQDKNAPAPEQLLYWFPELAEQFRPDMTDGEKLKLLQDRFLERLESAYPEAIKQNRIVSFVLHRNLTEGWSAFLYRMKQEIELSRSRFAQSEERSAYLTQYGEDLARSIYREKVREGIVRLRVQLQGK